jgi:hypothetical protein
VSMLVICVCKTQQPAQAQSSWTKVAAELCSLFLCLYKKTRRCARNIKPRTTQAVWFASTPGPGSCAQHKLTVDSVSVLLVLGCRKQSRSLACTTYWCFLMQLVQGLLRYSTH